MKKLLIVDDDPATRLGLSEFLHDAGFDCTGVGTFEEARTRLRTSALDLLITDIRLDAFNGLQLVISRPPNVQAIVITGFADVVLESEAARSGARYVRKPVHPGELLEPVRQMLAAPGGRRRHHAERRRMTRSGRRGSDPHG
ncbi:MAG: response regulator [Vicinamibacterales bacterium]